MSGSKVFGDSGARAHGLIGRDALTRGRARLAENLYPATVILAFAVLLPLAVILQNGMSLDGDSPFYLAVQQAFIDHGWPNVTPSLAGQIAERLGIPDVLQDGRAIRGLDGQVYGVHFWLYPLLSVPFALPFALTGGNTLYGFLLLNIVAYAVCAWLIGRSPALGAAGRSAILFSFAITTIHWYVTWPHPEVFTACLLIAASVLLLEGRFTVAAILTGIAATHNPSAVLMLGGVGAFQLHALLWDGRVRGAALLPALLTCAAQLLPGVAIAASPYLWSFWAFGVANPIVANGYIDYNQIGLPKLASLFFDWNQGFVLGYPFLLTVLAVALVQSGQAAWRRDGAVLRIEDVLVAAVIVMAVPVLAQVNFNAGQHYVSRYVSWLAAPMIVWAALRIDREARRVALIAWMSGVALYAFAYLTFFLHKVYYVLVLAPKGGPVYQEQLLFKPLAALILSVAPSLYDPWPELFVERSLGREVAIASAAAPVTAGYAIGDGTYVKIATRAADAETVSRALCPPGMTLLDDAGRGLSLRGAYEAGLGYRYINGTYRCR